MKWMPSIVKSIILILVFFVGTLLIVDGCYNRLAKKVHKDKPFQQELK